ncbi:hypothetical protein [Pyrococcus yayanosii]|uniref:HEAT repeat domain-containing protein n=1 Tax=Pyrococcus yayanosii (strain CH1 / JCM 16557) TaxID=529709 RepID=F8AH43_PYRYC|nr:hypothetical protein [Pyrococcus yayanosii]AEH24107.1 hypothetical protein PYCH_04170 [Pyrococcus yayanosii CH1]
MQEWYQSRGLYEMVLKLIERGNFETAIQVASTIPDRSMRAKSLAKIAVEMAKRGLDYRDALKKAEEAIFSLNGDSVAKFLMSLAFDLLEVEKFEDALEVASLIKDISAASKVKAEVALVLAKRGRIEEALRIIKEILDEDVKTWAMSRLATEIS